MATLLREGLRHRHVVLATAAAVALCGLGCTNVVREEVVAAAGGGGGSGGGGPPVETSTTSGSSSTQPQPPPDRRPGGLAEARCPDVAAEEQYCFTLDYGQVLLIGMESGSVCELAHIANPSLLDDSSSLAAIGDELYVCSHQSGLVHISAIDGGTEVIGVPCAGVTNYFDGLLATDDFAVFEHFETPQAMVAGEAAEVWELDDGNSRMTVHGTVLYTAWHSTNELQGYVLNEDEQLPTLPLQGFDDWVNGLSRTGPGDIVILSTGNITRRFNSVTGEMYGELAIDATGPLQGLACRFYWESP